MLTTHQISGAGARGVKNRLLLGYDVFWEPGTYAAAGFCGGGGGDSRLATRLYSDFTLGDGYLIYWFPDPSQTNFTGSGGR